MPAGASSVLINHTCAVDKNLAVLPLTCCCFWLSQ